MLRLAVGVALMLIVSQVMGMAGLLRTGMVGAVIAWMVVGAGMGAGIVRGGRRAFACAKGSLPIAGAPVVGVLALAACWPPGTLWVSEARGFDVLSYHLQLPREWLAGGRLEPLEHNVYSFLPSFMEGAFLHLGAMGSFLARDPFIDGEGMATFAAGLLHAGMALAAAWGVGTLTSIVLRVRVGVDEARGRVAGGIAGVIFLSTPWVVATGSLAYNEMAVCLLMAGAMIACETGSLKGARRGAVVGLLVGAACGAKPTALFMVGVPVGVLLLWRTPRGEWPRVVAAGAAAGIAALAPYLIRNALACGNPVFPYLTSIFGEAHWSALEVGRWRLGHHESAGIVERLGHLVGRRGLGHAQWQPGATAMILSLVGGAMARRSRGAALMLLSIAAGQMGLWLFIGHVQSRFLVPALVPMAAGAGVVIGLLAGARPMAARVVATLTIAGNALALGWIGYRETGGSPGLFAALDMKALTCEAESVAVPEVVRSAMKAAGAPGARLYLLGDSTPFYYRAPVLWHTTWDPSPLGVLLRETGGDLAESARRLAAAPPKGLGVTHVLVNLAEIDRLQRDGWYDPAVSAETAERLAREHGRVVLEERGPPGVRLILMELKPSGDR